MEKKVIVIHGCSSAPEERVAETRTYDKHWIPWLRRELLTKGVMAETPLMPTPWAPDFNEWKAELNKYEIDENAILIGHSCGAAFLVRWLGETQRKIAKLILVAPWKVAKSEGKRALYDFLVDETIKERVGEIVMFTADNEAPEGKENLEIFHNALGGRVIELKEHGHYTMDEMKTEEFPQLLRVVME